MVWMGRKEMKRRRRKERKRKRQEEDQVEVLIEWNSQRKKK